MTTAQFATDSNLRDLTEALACIAKYDHSISVPELGSVFEPPTPGLPHSRNTPLNQTLNAIAEVYEVMNAFISTGGTTTLNVLALSAATGPGNHVLIQRNSHVSVYAPIISVGLIPHYVRPAYSDGRGVPLGITRAQLEAALAEHPVSAVFLTYPDYCGIAANIAELVKVAKAHRGPDGKPPVVIVDAAHGAYFRFHPALPLAAEQSGADIILQSTHKTAGALSQGSLALITNPELVPHWYECVNSLGLVSTSFSYIIWASVALAIFQLALQGEDLLDEAIAAANSARERINTLQGVHAFGLPMAPEEGFHGQDPLRVSVNVRGLGETGFALEEHLIKRFRQYPEMATLDTMLFLFKPFHGMTEADRVVHAMASLQDRPRPLRPCVPWLPAPDLPRMCLTPREAFYARKRKVVPVGDVAGCISAETIACYPPGSAVVVAGEELTEDIIGFLQTMRVHGAVLKGASETKFDHVTIIEEA